MVTTSPLIKVVLLNCKEKRKKGEMEAQLRHRAPDPCTGRDYSVIFADKTSPCSQSPLLNYRYAARGSY